MKIFAYIYKLNQIWIKQQNQFLLKDGIFIESDAQNADIIERLKNL